MSRKLILLVAFMSLALVGSSFAAVENIKVSGDINAEAVTRDFALGNTIDNDDQFLFSQVRLRFDADLTEGVSAVIGLINERIWGLEESEDPTGNVSDNQTSDIDLDLAYIQLNEFLYQPLTVKIGRQNLYFGNGLIVGDPDTNQTAVAEVPQAIRDLSLRKSFDAIRGTLDYAPYTIDMIYAKVDENTINRNDDVTLFGVNVAYDWASYNGITEGYIFGSNKAPGTVAGTIDHKNYVYTLGGRAQMDPNDKVTLGLEGAYQFGDYRASGSSHAHLDAYAAQAMAEYRFLNDYNAKIGANYTYLSGDDSGSSDYNGWDPMFEDQTPGEIINTLFTNSNMQYVKLTGSMMPREDITLGLNYTYAFLDQKTLASPYTPTAGSPALASTASYVLKANEREIGHEVAAYGIYDYTEDVQIKMTGSWFIPGDLFASNNDNTGYSLRAGINVDF